ncbi:MAG: AAA family ATPase [Prevotella sp.]|nr:AAA family ATPase [Prevotella sp.]
MSKYVFTVPSYKAINSASIVNDGITVIAGENGSGKSTLSRMMYYTVNIMSDFAGFIFRETLSNVIDIARPLRDALGQTTHQVQSRLTVRKSFDQLSESTSFDDLGDNFQSMLNEYEPILVAFFSTVKEKIKQDRILDYLGVQASGQPETLATACINVILGKFTEIIASAQENIDKHPKALLLDYIRTYGLDLQDYPTKGVRFTENDVDLLISKFFSAPLSLHRAIYIDTPMAVNDNFNFSTRYWNNLNGLMNQEAVDGTKEEMLLRKKLRNILHGDILIEKDKFTSRTKLCYKRYDGLEIDLVNAATGFKSFAYLLRLLANGYLKNDTLLLIDEPEAHLHPQWIVEFANILVQLNKVLGVKVIVTSHNPDMVSAIRAISEAEGILENTRFYLAKCQDPETYKFDYVDLGTEIGPIFESFNIALNRIEFYGTRDTSL